MRVCVGPVGGSIPVRMFECSNVRTVICMYANSVFVRSKEHWLCAHEESQHDVSLAVTLAAPEYIDAAFVSGANPDGGAVSGYQHGYAANLGMPTDVTYLFLSFSLPQCKYLSLPQFIVQVFFSLSPLYYHCHVQNADICRVLEILESI